MKDAEVLIKKIERLSRKKVVLKEKELSEINIDKKKLENLARRAFIMTLHRQAVKQIYIGHFATLLQATEEKNPSKINEIMKKYKSKVLDLYENFTLEKDLLL